MKKAAGRILKSNNVRLEGRFRLDAGRGVPGSENARGATSAPAQVRIVENHPEFAILEVTCGCGKKTRIRCEYTDAQSIEKVPEQKK